MNWHFSFARTFAILAKEFLQMRRDRLTLGMIVGVPIMQLFLFGFAINFNPHALPTAISIDDPGPMARSVVAALNNSSYFDIIAQTNSPVKARRLLQQGKVLFVVEIPANFTRDIVRGTPPDLLVEVDATDTAAGSYAIGALNGIASTALRDDLTGPLAARVQSVAPFNTVTHLLYNPESITQYTIIPGLLAVILTMTMVLMTCLALTRERERGTYENLLAMPATPLEIMIGKISPNIVIGAIQSAIILLVAKFVFDVPMIGSLWLLGLALVFYITANLAVGYTFSTIAENQLQAMQMTMFFLLPAILLSGFAFPFDGMPVWAQWIGEVLPATHFLRVVRGILLKGNGFGDIWPDLWPLILFMFLVSSIALARFRRTLD
ncbi:MAG TPA: ABC transporter permease [Rhizomicrobium sp.]|jgi:ABC-2 type transport system permease protein|nr:ABC transporter permease [Rhizomicrobium sp.]